MKKKDKNKIAVGIVLVILVGIILSQTNLSPFAVSDISGQGENVNELELEGCFSVDSCKSMLLREGMPENFLEETNSIIQCTDKCVLKRQ